MNRRTIINGLALVALILVGSGCGAVDRRPEAGVDKKPVAIKDVTYLIDGEPVTLINGLAETEVAPGSASKKVTQYFGNEAVGDLNGDGKEDSVFILTQDGGGSGTFFYVVAALADETGYRGTNAILLGDRIAPQTTEIRDDKAVVNYADRQPGEPNTAEPSVGFTGYFQITDGRLVAVQPPETTNTSAGTPTESEARAIAERTCIKGGEALSAGTRNDITKTWWFDANLNATREGCSPACVVSDETRLAEINWRCTGLLPPR
jgi:hypothetical protein